MVMVVCSLYCSYENTLLIFVLASIAFLDTYSDPTLPRENGAVYADIAQPIDQL